MNNTNKKKTHNSESRIKIKTFSAEIKTETFSAEPQSIHTYNFKQNSDNALYALDSYKKAMQPKSC